MTVQEVAAYLQIHPSTVYKLIRQGQLPFFRTSVGGDFRFSREAIGKWIAARQQAK